MTRSDVAVLVVAKAPVPGCAKTRVAADVGPLAAARIAAASLLDTLCTAGDTFVHRVLALQGNLDHAEALTEIRAELRRWQVVPQHGDSFGERLAHSHRDAARLADDRPVLQLGMDTPQVSHELLDRLAAPLSAGDADAVLGLASDGGWWLLGLRDPAYAQVLTGVATSRPDTGHQTLAALQAAGARVRQGPLLRDVDSWGDALAVARGTTGSRFAAAVQAVVDAPTGRVGALASAVVP